MRECINRGCERVEKAAAGPFRDTLMTILDTSRDKTRVKKISFKKMRSEVSAWDWIMVVTINSKLRKTASHAVYSEELR